jgi:hypothetical protein
MRAWRPSQSHATTQMLSRYCGPIPASSLMEVQDELAQQATRLVVGWIFISKLSIVWSHGPACQGAG